jgi:hypothetical protein
MLPGCDAAAKRQEQATGTGVGLVRWSETGWPMSMASSTCGTADIIAAVILISYLVNIRKWEVMAIYEDKAPSFSS